MHVSQLSATSLLIVVLTCLQPGQPAGAQMPQVSKNRLGVDQVNLAGGQRVYGVVMENSADSGIRMLVQRKWLQRTHPEMFRTAAQNERQGARKSIENFTRRIDLWINESAGDELLVGFLADEKERIVSTAGQRDVADALFIQAAFPASEVRNVFLQPVERKRIAGLAWEHGLENVTTTSVTRLRKQLEGQGIDVGQASFDLSDEMPPLAPTDREWSIRQALVEHYYGDGLEFQGTRDHLLRKGEKPNLAQLISNSLSGASQIEQLGRELGLPEFQSTTPATRDWWKPATDAAERDGFKGVLVVLLDQSLLNSRVKVELSFFARIGDRWEKVVQYQGESDANLQQPEDLERVQNDPQLKQVLGQLQVLGLSPDHPQLQKAIRHGAATAVALEQARAPFQRLLTKTSQRIDAPLSIR